ncbi:MAG TPA: cobalamin-dependent protein [Lamprocystis sp. (in: g-proteobacteria)]|nr:cobalamin-dependent protein [Lamprocystis sp. (in: g-proteobacteria)]
MTTQGPGLATPDPTLSAWYPEFLAALVAGDRRQCETLTEQVVDAGVPILTIYQELFQRALYQVGEDWECNRISVGIEHLATAIVEGLLNRLYPQVIAPHRVGRRVLIASVEGELHQVGAKMACDVFEMHGWDTLYLGADTPTSELLRTLRELRPDAVGLSLSVNFHLSTLAAAIKAIRAAFPDLPMVIGGQGLRQVGPTRMPTLVDDPQVHYVTDLDDLERVIASLG